MSHKATGWAIQQRGLKPVEKILLWHLADRYNPKNGCYPSREELAHDCEVSVRSVERHIEALCEKGLVKKTLVKSVRKYGHNEYQLFIDGEWTARHFVAYEGGATRQPCRKPPDTGVVNRPSDCRTNLVTEPVIEPVNPSSLRSEGLKVGKTKRVGKISEQVIASDLFQTDMHPHEVAWSLSGRKAHFDNVRKKTGKKFSDEQMHIIAAKVVDYLIQQGARLPKQPGDDRFVNRCVQCFYAFAKRERVNETMRAMAKPKLSRAEEDAISAKLRREEREDLLVAYTVIHGEEKALERIEREYG